MTGPNPAAQSQIQAADPTRSTWLSANAGSGKTRVLTDRVALLLLRGADPRGILCLTYTKAAAGEMQNRLFDRLGTWAMLGDAKLEEQLRELGVAGPVDLDAARRLFAAAVETPGGLKIQTIHSFCAALLRRYPLEAGVSPRFSEMDDTAGRQLRADVADELAEGPGAAVLDGIARYSSGYDFDKLLDGVIGMADRFLDPSLADADAARARLWAAMGLAPGFSHDDLLHQVATGDEQAMFQALLPAMAVGKSTDVKIAARLGALADRSVEIADLPLLEDVLLYGSNAKSPFGSKAGAIPTADLRKSLPPELIDELNALMDRVEAARPLRLALAAAEKSLALHRFARAFLPAYKARMRQHGWLSFDDLILRARGLLSDQSVANWVLYQLDGGIDHILVDEAQDTSPVQWDVIELLAEELVSGAGAKAGRDRTLFVVGDKKQSIYSFQGADAEGFDRMRAHFEERLRAHSPLARRELSYSFRSSYAVLNAVDQAFAIEAGGGVETELRHEAYYPELAGRVDLWPLAVKADEPETEDDWEDPVDRVSPDHPTLELARQIARSVRRMLESGARIADRKTGFRALTPGDVLILVQRRGGTPSLFDEVIGALKAERLPVAGADRLKLKSSLAARDIVALLSFLALPEDSLSLATALRSPLFGWSEGDLFRLAAGRKATHLWEALRARAEEFPEAFAALGDLRDKVDFLRPYDLIERILIHHDGRNRLMQRLGAEAEDGIDELLNVALSYEQSDIPSLTGFLSWLEAEDAEIKRPQESAGGRIRVMTVHGSKGLEAPLVILPDTARAPAGSRGQILSGPDGLPLWSMPAGESPEVISAARETAAAAERRERERLLYVAMTRAQSWLIVCGAGEAAEGSWYARVRAGLDTLDTRPLLTPFGEGLRFQHGDWPADQPGAWVREDAAAPLPSWARARAPAPVVAAGTLSPSDLGGAKVLPGDGEGLDEEAALRRGRQIHRLLEHLPAYPADGWPDTARALLSHGEDSAGAEVVDALLAEAAGILSHPGLSSLFGPETLAEVELTATLPELGGRRLHGVVDRLIVREGSVLAVDFKTNAVVPATPDTVPDGLLRQMGAYAAALAQVYPGRRIETAILWTRTATLMPLPHDIVMAALQSAATS